MVIAMMMPFVVEVKHRWARMMAFVVTKLTNLVACMCILQFLAFLRSLCGSELWVSIKLFVDPLHVELGAFLAFCTLAIRSAFFYFWQVMARFQERLPWPRACRMACGICSTTVVTRVSFLHLFTQTELHVLVLVPLLPHAVPHCDEGYNSSQNEQR